MQYNFVAIEGNIGVGKTSLARKLSEDFNTRLILEQFSENPFLPKFYKSPEQYAFPLELFFMAERYHQLKEQKEQDLFQPFVVADYFFVKSKLFAQNNLHSDELQLFNQLFEIMNSSLSSPELLIYLHADTQRLQQNIKKRAREFEQNIPDNYLHNIQKRYLDYLRKQDFFPVVILDVTDVDFKKDNLVYNRIKKLINKKYELGVYQFQL